MDKERLGLLKYPFPPGDLEWRVQQGGLSNGKPWALIVCYINNRAIMDRLDETVGPENWANKFVPGPSGGVLCGIGIRLAEGEWIWKYDGAENTDLEPVKGGLSGSMKRAAVHWGIGRYLYGLEATFANIHDGGQLRGSFKDKEKSQRSGRNEYFRFKYDPPALPDWALPEDYRITSPNSQPVSEPEEGGPVENEPGGDPDPGWSKDELLQFLEIAYKDGKVDETLYSTWKQNLSRNGANIEAMRPAVLAVCGRS